MPDPTITTNTGTKLDEGALGTIGSTALAATDSDTVASSLTYTITTLPTHGTVRLNGTALALNGTFTQADIDGSKVTYLHDGSETTTDSFGFDLSDGTDGPTGETFNLSITPVNDAPQVLLPAPAPLVDQMEFVPGTGDLSVFATGESFKLDQATSLSSFTLVLMDSELGINSGLDSFSGTLSYAIYQDKDGKPDTIAGPLTTGQDSSVELSSVASPNGFFDFATATIDLDGYVVQPDVQYWIAVHEGAWLSPDDGSDVYWSMSGNDTSGIGNVFAGDPTSPSYIYDPTFNLAYKLTGLTPVDSATLSATEQVPLDLAGKISVADPDAGTGTITVTLAAGYGHVISTAGDSGVDVVGTDTSTVTLSGTLAQIQALLAGTTTGTIEYLAHTDDPPESTTLTVTVNDGGHTGSGVALEDSGTIAIAIEAVNDAPEVLLETALVDQMELGNTIFNISAYVEAESFKLTAPTSLSSFTIALFDAGPDNGELDNFIGTLSYAIYQDNGGKPDTDAGPLTTGEDDTVELSFLPGYTEDVATATIDLGGYVLGPGQYWIGVHEGASGSDFDGSVVYWVGSTNDKSTIDSAYAIDPTSPSYLESSFDLAYKLTGLPELSATEQVPLDLAGKISVADPDAGSGTIEVTLAAKYGHVSSTGGTGITVADNDSPTLTLTGTAADIQALLATTGAISYVAHTDDPPESTTLTVTVNDDGHTGTGGALEDSGTITINITAVDDAPVAVAEAYSLFEDSTLIIPAPGVLGNDSDPEGETLTTVLVSNVAHGTLALSDDGSFTYTPDANYHGTDSFTYYVSDGDLDSETVTVKLNVKSVNDLPVAVDDSVYAIDLAAPTFYSFATLLGNDSDADGDLLTITALSGMVNGTAQIVAGGVNFTPVPGTGGGAFDYTVSDGKGGSDTAHVTVTYSALNQAPVAQSDVVNGNQDQVLTIAPASLLGNDSDPDGDAFSILSVGNATRGSVALAGGNVVFTPTAGYSGSAGFDYLIRDANGAIAGAHVSVILAPGAGSNTAPHIVSAPDLAGTYVGTPVGIAVVAADADGDPLSYAASGAAHGTVSGGAGGLFTYTPAAGYAGADSFRVTVSDGEGGVWTTAIAINVVTPLAQAEVDFRLFTQDGFTGEIGGNGLVFGSDTAEDITVTDRAGQLAFSPSFSVGDDVIRLPDNAGGWWGMRVGSNLVLNDGDTFVTIPVGTAGTTLVFADGARTLVYDGGAFRLGDQVLGDDDFAPLSGVGAGSAVPALGASDGTGRLFLYEGAEATAGGNLTVFGTEAHEVLTVTFGAVQLESSWSAGGDRIVFDDPASEFDVSRVSSRAVFESDDTHISIPVSTAGATIATAGSSDAHSGTLIYDTASETMLIGTQVITTTPAPLTFG